MDRIRDRHTNYALDMIKSAIVTLKERNGSSYVSPIISRFREWGHSPKDMPAWTVTFCSVETANQPFDWPNTVPNICNRQSQQLSAIAVVRLLLTVFKGQFASHHTQNSISLCAILTISSRQALKKYVQSNNDTKTANFDALFNAALRKGVESGDFLQPKGPSGPVKLACQEGKACRSKGYQEGSSQEGKACCSKEGCS